MKNQTNRWNNPEELSFLSEEDAEVRVTCIKCLEKLRYRDTYNGTIAPYLVCVRCGFDLKQEHGNRWNELLPILYQRHETINIKEVKNMKNKWGNPEKNPPNNQKGYDTLVKCVKCLKNIRYGTTHKESFAPYLVCSRCGVQLKRKYGYYWHESLSELFPKDGKVIADNKKIITNAKEETIKILSSQKTKVKNNLRDDILRQIFE